MFNFFKKKEHEIFSPMNGKVIPINEVEDEAFSQKMLGDGVCIIPKTGEVVSPVSGEVVQVFDTLHAYGIKTANGAEILIHIGINTVELKGEGFKALVKSGQKVKMGEKIAEVDLEFIKEKGYSTQTPVVITNTSEIQDLNFNFVEGAEAGKTMIISYKSS